MLPPTPTIDHPHLRATENGKELVVNGRPFLVLGGGVQHPSFSSAEYMDRVWQNLADAHVNTVLGAVSWEMIEPEEGRFCFDELDKIILGARRHRLRLVLLWFGSFVNGFSTYVPGWVKTNPKRFRRAKLRHPGGVLKVAGALSVFHDEAPKCDARAFAALMQHLREFDEEHSTVIMVQVGRHNGILGDSRDGSPEAEDRFTQPVPPELTSFLQSDWENLRPDLRANFPQSSRQPQPEGTWAEVFGKGPLTDELFMAYHFALYLNQVAEAGKASYPIPLYTSVWLNVGNLRSGEKPGDYPSGGPVPHVLDIWQKFAPGLDFIGPDVYMPEYIRSCANYRHRDQPLFVAEQSRSYAGARRIWAALGMFHAIGVAPMDFDPMLAKDNPFTKHYALLESVSQIILEARRRPGSVFGFGLDASEVDDSDRCPPILRRFGDYALAIERCIMRDVPGSGCGMVIHLGGGRFLLIGWGFLVRAKAVSETAAFTGILRFEEKAVVCKETGELRTVRVFNHGDSHVGMAAVMPNEDLEHGGLHTVAPRTMIAEVEFYTLDEADV